MAVENDTSGRPLRPYVLAAGEGEPAASEGSTMRIKASAESTGGGLGLLEGVDAPGFATPLHRHDVAELWYILDGHYDFYVAGEWLPAGTGAVVFVPGGLVHGLRAGPAGGRKLTAIIPGGPEGFFRDMHRAIETDAGTPERIRALGAEYGIELIGPLPER
ncbi:cupin domain-containing protein [Actinoallomurus rhizosphaericola]|uniref:cupin domain-containing protein n=1 Tax=Actinoallomurus rhizosphaericola TaxID=2952536 RepID=UPI002093B237|nr:cupin domain-containing protein [Actinoallomurus rhizosphaericola]MCO5996290.1 cupin domain-containing protein [Actinoallomurus rhizosphaericola]